MQNNEFVKRWALLFIFQADEQQLGQVFKNKSNKPKEEKTIELFDLFCEKRELFIQKMIQIFKSKQKNNLIPKNDVLLTIG